MTYYGAIAANHPILAWATIVINMEPIWGFMPQFYAYSGKQDNQPIMAIKYDIP